MDKIRANNFFHPAPPPPPRPAASSSIRMRKPPGSGRGRRHCWPGRRSGHGRALGWGGRRLTAYPRPMRSQLLCLTTYVDQDVATRAADLSAALSRAPTTRRAGPHWERANPVARPTADLVALLRHALARSSRAAQAETRRREGNRLAGSSLGSRPAAIRETRG